MEEELRLPLLLLATDCKSIVQWSHTRNCVQANTSSRVCVGSTPLLGRTPIHWGLAEQIQAITNQWLVIESFVRSSTVRAVEVAHSSPLVGETHEGWRREAPQGFPMPRFERLLRARRR